MAKISTPRTYSTTDDGYPVDGGLWFDCYDCGGDGVVSRHDEDPLWYGEDDVFPCQTCYGEGGFFQPYDTENMGVPR